MELIYDDKTGTWGEAPETYGCIEFASKEAYEEAVNILKKHKELEAKHWDECRQIAHYDNELKEAKRLLRLAVEDIGKTPCNNDVYTPSSCDICEKKENCDYSESFKWRYEDEVMKLIGGGLQC